MTSPIEVAARQIARGGDDVTLDRALNDGYGARVTWRARAVVRENDVVIVLPTASPKAAADTLAILKGVPQ